MRMVATAALLALAGCASLPAGGPTVGQLLRPPAETLGAPIRVVAVEGLVLPPLGPADAAEPFALPDAPELSARIAPGDSIAITIFEVGVALFGAAPNASSGGGPLPTAAGQSLPPRLVGGDGLVSVPYAGSIAVAGRTPREVEAAIEARLRGRSQAAQAIVSVTPGPARAVIVSGDVRSPGRQPLSLAGERLTDAIAVAGGPNQRRADTFVRLTRGDATAEARLDRLAVGSAADVRLAPGDRIELVRRPRSFTVLGATRSVAELPFDSDRVSLAEAIARAGGPLDERADARGVFLFRFETKDGAEVPVIYRLDLINPQAYFAAQRFLVRDKDVLFVANARSNSLQRFLTLLNLVSSPALGAAVLTR
ncbi:hypothetical protein IP88_15290 [alpha proteobacterium AAP81b]|nr:hypothetical protein IP88_15290 [alpha proteobacterium AAP81b]